jgi:hypothetical protein
VDKVSTVLEALTGHSLKEDLGLWEGFQNLRGARNRYVHEGEAKIGNQAVTSKQAATLLGTARQIMDWLEELLPEGARRIRYETQHQLQLTHAIT